MTTRRRALPGAPALHRSPRYGLAAQRRAEGMALSWIKMRTDLARDGRVRRVARMTGEHWQRVVGAFFVLWSIADEQTVEGRLDGWTFDEVDEEVGFPGFAQAASSVGWLSYDPSADAVDIPNFREHNGQSAKRRATDGKRKASARNADNVRTDVRTPCGQTAELEEEEDKRRDTQTTTTRAREDAEPPLVPDEPPVEVVKSFEGWKRKVNDAFRLSTMDHRALTCWWRDEAPQQDVDVGDGVLTPAELFAASVDDAIANGAEFSGRAIHALKYITKTIERCAAERRRPGVKAHGPNRSGSTHRETASDRRSRKLAGQYAERDDEGSIPIWSADGAASADAV